MEILHRLPADNSAVSSDLRGLKSDNSAFDRTIDIKMTDMRPRTAFNAKKKS